MFINIIKSCRNVVAICDSDLLGKTFVEGGFQIDVKENFYKGEETEEENAIKVMQSMAREDATFNIVGKTSINVALKAGIIAKENIREIKEIPYSMVLL
jgi:uncharacterized protein